MTTAATEVRVFISSPGDVAEERDQARRVLEGLQRLHPATRLVPVLWEDLALPATASLQEAIEVVLDRQPIDIAVFILWSRLGSPLGPAVRRPDGTPYRSGTEREFDLMLAAFQQSGQQRPVILAYARQDEQGFHQVLARHPEEQWRELISQRELAKAFIQEQFHDAEGRSLRAYHSYPEPVSFAHRLHTHLRQVLAELLGGSAERTWLNDPYRGLDVFDVEHAPIFHGRDEETCDLLQRLRERAGTGCASVVVVGASGSGKSSIARAGVAAALTQHAYDDAVDTWRAISFFPSSAEDGLVLGLTRALARALPELCDAAIALDRIAAALARDPVLTTELSIAPAFARAAAAANGEVRLLLV